MDLLPSPTFSRVQPPNPRHISSSVVHVCASNTSIMPIQEEWRKCCLNNSSFIGVYGEFMFFHQISCGNGLVASNVSTVQLGCDFTPVISTTLPYSLWFHILYLHATSTSQTTTQHLRHFRRVILNSRLYACRTEIDSIQWKWKCKWELISAHSCDSLLPRLFWLFQV